MKLLKYLMTLPLLLLLVYSGCESNDAVSTSVYIPQPVNKKVLVEFFTNSYCQPCVASHNYWDQVNAVGGLTLNDTSVIVLSYHAKSPNPADSLYRANIQQSDARYNYYGVFTTGTPNNQIDGTYMGQFAASNFTALVNAEFRNTRYLDVSLSNSFDGIDSGTVTANIKALTALPTTDNVIHIVISENNISYITAPNGVTNPDDVMRNMVTGSLGESISLTPNQIVAFSKDYRLLPKWKSEDCYITVFVQSTSTKQIYGVERIKVSF
jgi:hypothetical protein